MVVFSDKGYLILRHAHGADGEPVEAAVVVPVPAPRIEVEAVGDERVVGIERARPTAAVGTRAVEGIVPAAARSGQEQCITIGTCHQASVHAVLSRPRPSTLEA